MSHHDHDHEHDLGFAHDLGRMLGRRRLLALMGGVGVASLSGLPAFALDCVALPWETQGPYPADGTNSRDGQVINVLTQEGVIREDLRPSFGTLTSVAEGLELDLELTLVDAEGCTPLADHAIYIWHCDTEGRYSLYDIADANFLRGVGISDAEGKVRFTTIFPGCYDGRWPHIHFEVFRSASEAVGGESAVLTAQIAMPEALSAEVYAADSRYPTSSANLTRITLASDNVFGDNSADQIAQQTLAVTGSTAGKLSGTLTIPIDFTAERGTTNAPSAPGGNGPGGPPPGAPPSN